jgi:hypothetical protein
MYLLITFTTLWIWLVFTGAVLILEWSSSRAEKIAYIKVSAGVAVLIWLLLAGIHFLESVTLT